ncbi:unannotated protein [freshwater metagenome]|uniref:Unannotated protein n=1 Tax=freshwater metagenome TaxID=449393 RepID=A0A6J6V9T8_9ZZZZ
MLSVCIAGLFRVAINEGARVVGAKEPFVRIDDEAVGVFDAIEQVANAWCAQSSRAVCTVNMKPCVKRLGLLRHAFQIIDDTNICGARCGNNCAHAFLVLPA